jgi:hypothetical protein
MQPAAGPAAVQADANARRCRLASSPTATILGALVFVLTVIAVPLAGLTAINVGSDVVNLIFAGVGIIVARRQPRNPIGWILLIFIFMAMLGDTAGARCFEGGNRARSAKKGFQEASRSQNRRPNR